MPIALKDIPTHGNYQLCHAHLVLLQIHKTVCNVSDPIAVWETTKSWVDPLLAMHANSARQDSSQVQTELNVLDQLLTVNAQRDSPKMDSHVFHAHLEQSKARVTKKYASAHNVLHQDRLLWLLIIKTVEDARCAQHHTSFPILQELYVYHKL